MEDTVLSKDTYDDAKRRDVVHRQKDNVVLKRCHVPFGGAGNPTAEGVLDKKTIEGHHK